MKTKFTLIVFLLFSLILKSQNNHDCDKEFYFDLKLIEKRVLDSLEIPYLSIPQRNGWGPIRKVEVDKNKLNEHNKFFNKNDFAPSPTKNTSSLSFDTFFRYHKFITEKDRLYLNTLSAFNLKVIGSSIIELTNSKNEYKTVQIIEYRFDGNNTYGTLVLLGTEENFMKFVY